MKIAEYNDILANATIKMNENGVKHAITEKCYVFSYIRDITAIKALKDMVTDIKAEVDLIFDLYYLFTITSKGIIKLPDGKLVKAHSLKINMWTEDTPKNQPSGLALTLNTPNDILRDSFKVQVYNVIGQLLTPFVFVKEAQRRKEVIKEQAKKPKSTLVMPNGKPIRA